MITKIILGFILFLSATANASDVTPYYEGTDAKIAYESIVASGVEPEMVLTDDDQYGAYGSVFVVGRHITEKLHCTLTYSGGQDIYVCFLLEGLHAVPPGPTNLE